MNELLIVETIHVLTFCWIASRGVAGRDAWKPQIIDSISGIIAASSWLILVLSSIGGGSFGEVAAKPLISLGLVLVVIVVYTILIAIFYLLRRSVWEIKRTRYT